MLLLMIEDNPFFDKKMFFQKKMMKHDETITLWGNLKLSPLRKTLKERFLEVCENDSHYEYCMKCFDKDKIFKGKIEVHPFSNDWFPNCIPSLWVKFCDVTITDVETGDTETCWRHRKMVEFKFNYPNQYYKFHQWVANWAWTESRWNKKRMDRDEREKRVRQKRREEMVKEDNDFEKFRQKTKEKENAAEAYFVDLHDKDKWPELDFVDEVKK